MPSSAWKKTTACNVPAPASPSTVSSPNLQCVGLGDPHKRHLALAQTRLPARPKTRRGADKEPPGLQAVARTRLPAVGKTAAYYAAPEGEMRNRDAPFQPRRTRVVR